jgi:hypothetical protein
MTTEITIEVVASEAYGWFTTTQRNDETITVLKDDHPEWVRDIVYAGHGKNFLPDDWRYEAICSALEAIGEGDEDGTEWADQNVDVYTNARFAWLSSNLQRQGYVDEATEEFGQAENGVADAIGMGQYLESREVFNLVLDAVRERVDELELEEGE